MACCLGLSSGFRLPRAIPETDPRGSSLVPKSIAAAQISQVYNCRSHYAPPLNSPFCSKYPTTFFGFNTTSPQRPCKEGHDDPDA